MLIKENQEPYLSILLEGRYDEALEIEYNEYPLGKSSSSRFKHYHAVCYFNKDKSEALGGAIIANNFEHDSDKMEESSLMAANKVSGLLSAKPRDLTVVSVEISDPTSTPEPFYTAALCEQLKKMAIRGIKAKTV
jgi:hypothetical protein